MKQRGKQIQSDKTQDEQTSAQVKTDFDEEGTAPTFLRDTKNESLEKEVLKSNKEQKTSAEIVKKNIESTQPENAQDDGVVKENKITSEENKKPDEDIPEFQQANNVTERESLNELGISEEIVSQKMKEVLEQNTPKKRRKSNILYICLMIVNIVLVAFIVKGLLSSLEGASIASILKSCGKNLWWLVGGLFMYIFFVFIQTVAYRTLLKNLSGKKSWKIAYEAAVIGKYYDNITPFSVGGQGMQIVRFAENGIGAGVSTSIPILKLIINSGTNSFLALLSFVIGMPLIPKGSPLNDFLILFLEILGVIGLIITILITLFIFLISRGKIITRTLVSGVLRLGYKLKIVKDYRTTYKKVMNQVAEYKSAMSYLNKHKKIMVQLVLCTVLEWLSFASFAFFVVMAFAETFDAAIPLFVFLCFAKYYICSMASCYIPLPGGTGLMEISFVLLFGVILGNNVVLALLCWRFFTYYLIVLHGFLHECVKIGSSIVKNKREKKQIGIIKPE